MATQLDFAMALLRELPGDGNVAWSPYSVVSALGVAAAGARGETHDELVRALGGEPTGLGQALIRAARLDNADVAVANTLWTRLDLPFEDDYLRAILGWPGGALHTADFGGDPAGSRVKINADVDKTTHGLIKELLDQGVITVDTAAVMVNALYLKVAWREAFAEGATRSRPFHAPSGTRDVATMHHEQRMPYAEADGWRMVTLPTESEVVVDVLLPAEGLTDLAASTLARLYDSAASTKIGLALPKFRIQASATLNEPLRALGIVTAFTRDADFSGITPARIRIDKIVHEAVLRVDEQGFEGAAATAVVMRLASFDAGRPVSFHVDRPFLLLVRHAPTGSLYFSARVTEP